MYFRRELDFDDLIETIDQLADEEIDEVVDWQLTDSPAAKTENPAGNRAGLGSVPGSPWLRSSWTSRIAQAAGEAMNELLTASQVPPAQVGGRSPQWVQRLQEQATSYTLEQLMELRNEAWRSGNRDAALGLEARIQERDRPRARTYLPLSGNIVIAPLSETPLWTSTTLQDGSQFTPIRYRTIQYNVETMVESAMDIIHVRLSWGEVGGERYIQQTAAPREAVQALSRPIGILRADITPERRLGVELDPRRDGNVVAFMESA